MPTQSQQEWPQKSEAQQKGPTGSYATSCCHFKSNHFPHPTHIHPGTLLETRLEGEDHLKDISIYLKETVTTVLSSWRGLKFLCGTIFDLFSIQQELKVWKKFTEKKTTTFLFAYECGMYLLLHHPSNNSYCKMGFALQRPALWKKFPQKIFILLQRQKRGD